MPAREVPRYRLHTVVLLGLALALAGCRQDMHDQPVIEPYEASVIFSDGAGSRPMVEGAIARGQLRADPEFYTGLTAADAMVETLPVPVTRKLLERGQTRFNAFCAPCHDRTGSGLGMIVRRGFKQPASFHEERLRQQPVGYFYSVISNGFGDMSSYAAQIPPEDRWAIVAYLRTMQWSRAVSLEKLPETLRSQVESDLVSSLAAPPDSGPGEE